MRQLCISHRLRASRARLPWLDLAAGDLSCKIHELHRYNGVEGGYLSQTSAGGVARDAALYGHLASEKAHDERDRRCGTRRTGNAPALVSRRIFRPVRVAKHGQ